jgi:hypothetical protein
MRPLYRRLLLVAPCLASLGGAAVVAVYYGRNSTGVGPVPTRSAFAGRLPSTSECDWRRFQFAYATNRAADDPATFAGQESRLGSEISAGTFDVRISPYLPIDPRVWFEKEYVELPKFANGCRLAVAFATLEGQPRFRIAFTSRRARSSFRPWNRYVPGASPSREVKEFHHETLATGGPGPGPGRPDLHLAASAGAGDDRRSPSCRGRPRSRRGRPLLGSRAVLGRLGTDAVLGRLGTQAVLGRTALLPWLAPRRLVWCSTGTTRALRRVWSPLVRRCARKTARRRSTPTRIRYRHPSDQGTGPSTTGGPFPFRMESYTRALMIP